MGQGDSQGPQGGAEESPIDRLVFLRYLNLNRLAVDPMRRSLTAVIHRSNKVRPTGHPDYIQSNQIKSGITSFRPIHHHRLYPQFLFRDRPRVFISRT